MTSFDVRAHTILLTMAGSRVYGMHRPDSDVDLRGACVPPARFLHGFHQKFEQADDDASINTFADLLTGEAARAAALTKLEGTVYDVRKVLSLAAESNPNLLDLLFCRDEDVLLCTTEGALLREARHLTLSRRVKQTFGGYANAQLKRIETHRRWLLDPPAAAPKRAAFGLPENTLLPADQLAAAAAAVRKKVDGWELDFTGAPPSTAVAVHEALATELAEIALATGHPSVDALKWSAAARLVGLDDNLILVMQRERSYEAAAREFRQYETWRTSRNPERAGLEAHYGYDTKHAAHLMRLLRMGREILETGSVMVWRGPGGAGDADELCAIRAGAWSYERLTEARIEAMDALEAAATRSPLPPRPDIDALDALCVRIVESRLRG